VLRFTLLGSGSGGNATLVQSEHTTLLLDCGLSYRRLAESVEAAGVPVAGIDAVLVTHEHGDHVQSVGTLARRLGTPVYLTAETHRALPPKVGSLPEVRHFEAGDTWSLGDVEISSFSVTHDACDPVAFALRSGEAKAGFVTDAGSRSPLMVRRLAGAQALVLESNYCPDLLHAGKYPLQVKQRIRGRHGHLSNHDMASLLSDLIHPALQTVVLVHISENNNCPDQALRLARGALKDHPAEVLLARQDGPTPWIEVRA
jgi:phosphoribosyl 1,2-cyclic phosphodiesterase